MSLQVFKIAKDSENTDFAKKESKLRKFKTGKNMGPFKFHSKKDPTCAKKRSKRTKNARLPVCDQVTFMGHLNFLDKDLALAAALQ